MINDHEIIVGNHDNLQDFKIHFNIHDKKTLNTYYRMAKKKQAMMIVRRLASSAPQMQIVIVPYQLADSKGGIREALKSKYFPLSGFVKTLAIDPKRIFVFGELIPKYEGKEFSQPTPEKKKRKPFEQRI